MKWSWRIGRAAGIDVYLHATFLILLAWFGWNYYQYRHNLHDVINGLAFIGTVFFIVLLHELGHALAARRYGIETRDITLLPIGGVARLDRMPDKPMQELVVALAGPAVNVVLAAILYILLRYSNTLASLTNPRWVSAPFMVQLLHWNVLMAGFNLIPAFPMDGGRVLRALLALRLDYVRSTQIAATIGQGLALVLGCVGLLNNHPMWAFIALFVWVGALGEASMVQMKSSLGGIPIMRVMITDFRTLLPGDRLSVAVGHILAGFQNDFPVIEEGRVVGMLTRSDLFTALAQRGENAPVGEVMQRVFETADPSEMAEAVFSRLQECDCHSLPVVQGSQVVGLVTAENVGEFLIIQAALRGEKPGKMAAKLVS